MSNLNINQQPSLVDRMRHPLVLALALVCVALLYGYSLATSVPLLLLLVIPTALLIGVCAIVKPEFAAVALVGITWGYISEAAIKAYGAPSTTKPLVALLVLTLVIRRFTGRRRPFVSDPTIWWMGAYFLIICFGLGYADYPDRTWMLVVDFAKDFLLFLVIINLITSIKLFENTLWLLFAICALIASLTVYQEITSTHYDNYFGLARIKVAQIREGIADRPRAGGPTGEPLAFGQQLLILIPASLWAVMYNRKIRWKLAALYVTAVLLAGVGLSFSRSSFIGLGVALALFALHIRLNPRYLMVILPLMGILLYAAPMEFTARFATLENLLPGGEGVNTELSYRQRSVEMLMAVNMFADHPFIGVGGWNYRKHYPEYIRAEGSPVPDAEREPHSFYLEIAAEHGVLGLIAFGGILLLTWQRLSQAQRWFREAGNYRMAELSAAMQCGFAGYLVTAIFFHGVYSRFLWLQVSLAVALAMIAKRTLAEAPVQVAQQPPQPWHRYITRQLETR